MSTLITNLPSYEVWVRKEYLTDHKSGHGEFVKGVWVSAKSIPGRAFYFETYLPEYAAMFDKLPISAFLSSPELPDPDMTLHNLQFWNCMDYGVVAVQKQFIGSMHYEVYTRDYGTQTEELGGNWSILAEAVQTVLRKSGDASAYNRIKKLTRGRPLNQKTYIKMVNELDLDKKEKAVLLSLTPSSYLGEVAKILENL